MARESYSEYTDKIEPYGIDEAWLDVSDSRNLKGSGMTIAREISHRIKYELGVTVSIGISWTKIYAKLDVYKRQIYGKEWIFKRRNQSLYREGISL